MSNFEGCLLLTRVRLSFPNIAVPRAPQGSDKKRYSADFILTPQDPNYPKFCQLIQKVATEKWPKIHPQVLASINNERKRRCYGAGQERMDDQYNVLVGYEGMNYISAARNEDKGMPQIIGPDNQPIAEAIFAQNEARKLYGGCYVNAVVKPWAYDNQWGKGLSADLVAIQFCADGESFGEGVTDASAMFAGVQVAAPMPGAAPMGFPGAPGGAPGAWPPPQMPGAAPMPAMPFPGAQPPQMPGYAPAPQFPPMPVPGAVPPGYQVPPTRSPWG